MPMKPVLHSTTNRPGVMVKNSDCNDGEAGEGAGDGKAGDDSGLKEVFGRVKREMHYYFT